MSSLPDPLASIDHDRPDSDVYRVLDQDGSVLPNASVPDLTDDELRSMYEDVRLARRFDERAISLQRQGRISTYAPMTGQEGAQVACGYALDGDDWVFPTYREHALKYVHGMDLTSLLLPLRGHRDGYAIPDDVNVLPEYIPIATQLPQAMGFAWGKQLQGETDAVAMCHFGDGATSEGDFHEGMNFAGVFDAPVVFVCHTNQWAISVPRERQTASETIAQKADAYGIDGVRVDGTDPLAVYQVAREAVLKAKCPSGDELRPSLLEVVLYRFGAHTTADDPSQYRDEEEAERWRRWDPVNRLERFLYETGRLDSETQSAIEDRLEERLEAAIDEAEAAAADVSELAEHLREEPPERLREQLAELESVRERYGEEAFRHS